MLKNPKSTPSSCSAKPGVEKKQIFTQASFLAKTILPKKVHNLHYKSPPDKTA